MKKVLLVVPLSTTEFGSRNAGGVDSVCQMLVEYLGLVSNSEISYRVVAFNPFSDGKYTSNPIKFSDTVELFYYPCKEKKYGIHLPSLVSCNFRVMQQVNEYKPDIIHSHLGVWLLGGFRVKHRLSTVHAYKKIGRKSLSFFNDLVYERLMPKITDLVVTEYTAVGALLKEALLTDTHKKVSIVGNPIASVFLSIKPKQNKTNRVRFVTCALITRNKRIEASIMLLKIARCIGIDAELVIIGPATDKPYVNELKIQIMADELAEFVYFVGACNQKEIVNYYQSAHLGLFFSIEETFGLAPLEMIAAGLPVIMSKVGVVSERYNEFSDFPSVLIVDDLDLNLIAEKILPILDADATKAKNFVNNQYSIESVLDSYESIYRSLN